MLLMVASSTRAIAVLGLHPPIPISRARLQWLVVRLGKQGCRAAEEACRICHLITGALFAAAGGWGCLGYRRVAERKSLVRSFAGLLACRFASQSCCAALTRKLLHLFVVVFTIHERFHYTSSMLTYCAFKRDAGGMKHVLVCAAAGGGVT